MSTSEHFPASKMPSRAVAAATDRVLGIDAMRFVAIVGVVFIHATNQQLFGKLMDAAGRFAVPFFFVVSGYFSARAPIGSFSSWRAMLRRTLLPFVVWLAIYLIWLQPPLWTFESRRRVLMLFFTGGEAFHLWFFPSLVICSSILMLVRGRLGWTAILTLGGLSYALGLAFGAYFPAIFETHQEYFNTRDGPLFGLLFMIIGCYCREHRVLIPLRYALLLFIGGGALQVIEIAAITSHFGKFAHDQLLGTIPFGVGAFALSQHIPANSATRLLAYFGRFTLGIFCVHLMVLKVLIFRVWHVDRSALLAGQEISLVFAALAISLAISLAMSRVNSLRFLVK